jgi:hypothetical protein
MLCPTLTKLPIACESYISKSVSRQELQDSNTTLNPSCGFLHFQEYLTSRVAECGYNSKLELRVEAQL